MTRASNILYGSAAAMGAATTVTALTDLTDSSSGAYPFPKALNTVGVPIAFTLMAMGILLDMANDPKIPTWKKVAAGGAVVGLVASAAAATATATGVSVSASVITTSLGFATTCFAAMNLNLETAQTDGGYTRV